MADSLANLRSVGGMEYNRTSGVRKRSRCDDDDDYEAYDRDSDFVYAFGDYSDNDQLDFHDWKSGLLYTRALGVVTLSLMNSEGKIKSRACDIAFDRHSGIGFALVDSNLYAFARIGSCQIDKENIPCCGIEEFFVCDINDSSVRFKRAGKLRTPKIVPLVIPYYGSVETNSSKKKIFIIPTCNSTDIFRPPEGMSCEVIHLPENGNSGYHETRTLKTPFDRAFVYRFAGDAAPFSNGFVVSGKYAYISLSSGEWGGRDRLVCLDMDAEKFKFCDDPRPITTTIEPEVVSQVEEEHVKACDSHFMKAIEKLWGYVGCICRDKYIRVGLSLECDTPEIHVSAKLSQPIEFDEKPSSISAQLGVERLEELEVFVNGQLKDYSYLVHAWTLPYDTKEEDTFSIFICYMTTISDRYGRLFVCNFELVDQSETTDSIDDASASAGKKSRYTFKILSCASYEDFIPEFSLYAHAFTLGGSNFTLNNW